MSDWEDFDVRRIIVALDATTSSTPTVDAAAHMAARLQADLAGLFVEQQELLDLEDHAGARLLSLPGGQGGPAESGRIERELRSMALKARREFERASRRWRLRVSFDVTRGRLEPAVVDKTAIDDLVVVSSRGRRLTRAVRLPSSGAKLGASLDRSVLFLTRGVAPIRSVVVLYDDSRQAASALGAARRLAETDGIMLTVLVVGDRREDAAQMVQSVEAQVPPNARVHVHRIADDSAPRIARAVQSVHGDLFIVGRDTDISNVDDIQGFLSEMGCPILVVR